MSVVANQLVFQGGSKLLLAPADSSWVATGGVRDVGTVKILNPKTQSTKISLKDSRSGKMSLIDERVIEWMESFDVETANLTLDNAAFLLGGSVTTYSQAATPLTGIVLKAYKGTYTHLLNGSGERCYNIASVESVKDATDTTTYTAGTDYLATADMLKEGRIYIPAASTIGEGDTIHVAFTPTAISSARRLIKPHTVATIRALGEVVWLSTDGELMARDQFRCTVTGTDLGLNDADYSFLKFTVNVIENTASATEPAGRFLMPVGTLPPLGKY